jgi:heat-inducible transcriptional repressor
MKPLTQRQETILALIVHDYVETAKPTGSKTLVSKYNLGVSSATVRNEMALLTELGLLRQPHTSAGRVPTEKGYRYFVRKLLGDADLPATEKRQISHQFHQAKRGSDEWIRLAATILAQQSKAASVVTAPSPEWSIFKQMELIATQEHQVLLVLVLQGGDVRQQMLALAEVIHQEQLRETSALITRVCSGKNADQVARKARQFEGLAQEVTDLISEIMARADAVWSGEIYRDGISNMLALPEFVDSPQIQQVLRLLEERSYLEEILAKVLNPRIGDVQVVIGGEGAWEELKDFSIVLARYGAPGRATGALGVLGPTRMAYGRTISAVSYVAGLLSDLVVGTYSDS